MAWTAPRTWVTGELVTSTIMNAHVRDNLSFLYNQLATTTLAANAANIDFQSIPSGYSHLLLVVFARGDTAAVQDLVLGRFNNDSAANYYHERMTASGAVQTDAEGLAANALYLANMTGATATANRFGGFCAVIPNYSAAAGHKLATAFGLSPGGTTTGTIAASVGGGVWASTAAINRLTLIPNASANFVISTRATLYGLI